jgi:hypothetical protein
LSGLDAISPDIALSDLDAAAVVNCHSCRAAGRDADVADHVAGQPVRAGELGVEQTPYRPVAWMPGHHSKGADKVWISPQHHLKCAPRGFHLEAEMIVLSVPGTHLY